MKRIYVTGLLLSTLITGMTVVGIASSEMDPTPVKKQDSISAQSRTEGKPNVIIVKIDENGNETYYAGQTQVTKEAVKDSNTDAEKAIQEIVTDKNRISKPRTDVSKDEMDQANSTPQWFYIGTGIPGLRFGLGWGVCGYRYYYTYCPPPPPRFRPLPPPCWGPRPYYRPVVYRFYWC